MNIFDLTFDLSSYAYDVDNPTQQSERLCFILYQILDTMKSNGLQFRQTETADITDVEGKASDIFDILSAPIDAENLPEFPTLTSNDTAFDGELYEAFSSVRDTLTQAVQDTVSTGGGGVDEIIAELQNLVEVGRLSLGQEFVLQLSDGRKILWKSQLLDG